MPPNLKIQGISKHFPGVQEKKNKKERKKKRKEFRKS